jgi:hypothetical protein
MTPEESNVYRTKVQHPFFDPPLAGRTFQSSLISPELSLQKFFGSIEPIEDYCKTQFCFFDSLSL